MLQLILTVALVYYIGYLVACGYLLFNLMKEYGSASYADAKNVCDLAVHWPALILMHYVGNWAEREHKKTCPHHGNEGIVVVDVNNTTPPGEQTPW